MGILCPKKTVSFFAIAGVHGDVHIKTHTPPKFNMEPENDGFQEELPFLDFSRDFFSGSMLNFGGVLAKQDIPSKDLLFFWNGTIQTSGPEIHKNPIGSMYGIFIYIWLNFMVHVVEYTIHGSYIG